MQPAPQLASPGGVGVALSDAALKFMEMAGGMAETAADASPANKWQHPPSFYCPISQQCLHDPVVLSDGHSYERRHIERWLQEHNTSPVSNEELPQKGIFPNHALRNSIEEYFQQVFSVHRRAIRKTIRGPETSPKSLGSNEPLLHTIDALMQCSFLMNADLSTEVVLRQIMDEAKALLGAEVASVFLVDAENKELYSNVNSTSGELRVPITAGIAGHVATTGDPLIIGDAYADKRFNKMNDMKTGFRTRNMMCVPLKVKKGGVLGVVQLINKTDAGVFAQSHALAAIDEESPELPTQATVAFTLHDLQFLQVFASQAATAIVNSGGLLQEPQKQMSSEEIEDTEPAHGMCDLMKYCMAGPLQQLAPKVSDSSKRSQEFESSSSALEIASPGCSTSVTIPSACSTSGTDIETHIRSASEEDLAAARMLARCAEDNSPHQKRWRSRISRSFSMLDEVSRAAKVAEVLADAFSSWQFDAFALAQLTDNKPLSTLGVYLFEHLGLTQRFDLDSSKVKTFFEEIEKGYDNANSYHNRAHAASVLQSMHALLEHGGIAKATASAFNATDDPTGQDCHLERMACLIAAAVHDFEHLGFSNDFLVKSCDKRAMMYNDQHVNENHHVAAAFAVLSRSECNFLTSFSLADWRRLRGLVVELVLSTDMANGGRILKTFNEAFVVPLEGGTVAEPVPTSAKDATLLLQMAIKCADLGHLALSWNIHKKWVALLEEEFFAQGDEEKNRGHPVSFLMDRDQPGCSKTQTGFFKFVVLPIFQSLVSVAPGAQPVLDQIMSNYQGWQEVEAAAAKNQEEQNVAEASARGDARNGEPLISPSDALHSNGSEESVESRQGSKGSTQSNEDEQTNDNGKTFKRSGRARQRAAKWWAAVRRETPSPDTVSPCCVTSQHD